MMSERIFRRTPDGNKACQNLDLIENRAMRMVLMQVDGVQTEEGIIKKLGSTADVKKALMELELQGFIYLAPSSSKPPSIPPQEASSSANHAQSDALLAKLMAEAGNNVSASGDIPNPYAKPEKKAKKKKVKKNLPPPPPPKPVDTRTAAEIEAELKAQEAIFHERRAAFKNAARMEAERQARPLHVTIINRTAKTLVILLILAILGIFFFPYNMLRNQFASQLSLLLERDVQIASMSMQWGEEPYLRIQGIGDVQTNSQKESSFVVNEAQVDFLSLIKAWANGAQWGADTKLQLSGVSLSVEDLFRFTQTWRSNLGQNRTPFNFWQLNDVSLKTPQGNFNFSKAEIHFAPDGQLKKWVAFEPELGWNVTLTPSDSKTALNVDFQAQDWKPLGKTMRFIGVRAQGLLTEEGLDLPQTNVGVFDGRIEGAMKINWKKGFQLNANGNVSVMSLKVLGRHLAPGVPLDGTISGKIILTSNQAQQNWHTMWKNLLLKFDLSIYNGKFVAMNLPDILRTNQVTMIEPIGFAKLQTRGEWHKKTLNARIINMNAGQLLVNADFSVSPNLNVNGMWLTDINTQVMRRELKIQLSGQLPKVKAQLIQDRSH